MLATTRFWSLPGCHRVAELRHGNVLARQSFGLVSSPSDVRCAVNICPFRMMIGFLALGRHEGHEFLFIFVSVPVICGLRRTSAR